MQGSATWKWTVGGAAQREALESRMRWPALGWAEFAVPALVLAGAVYGLQVGGGDVWLADRWYALEGGRWALKDAFVTEILVHRVGKYLSVAAWLLVLALALHARGQGRRGRARVLGYLALSVLLATTAVSVLKQLTGLDCPWALTRYGGTLEHFDLFATRPADMPRAACFPAGHASAGYAWIALYFAGRAEAARWRGYGLAVGLGAGALFGLAQQARGAHFLSHDLATLLVCWLVAGTLYACCRAGCTEGAR